ncbi:hypothetical protein [uncultured Desulfosarcina sp.]|uniref:hypothetical protein n=1 Tax=uncultured Desulfosarcina sp. TaxID=218289 RepID=UPI0029C71E4E|nr:hypothetical protein [uncultured Desulfosarcina sp.]
MPFQSNIFNSKCRELGDGNHLHFVNISALDDKITKYIDASIVSICEGAACTDLATIKQRLIAFLTPKKGTTTEMGAIAEFFSHLYLTEVGFNQEFLFLNLEEGSIKKGFDGYYTFDGESWIYESKSGSTKTEKATHDLKVSLAYADLKEKISGNPANNPWQNAYNHACHIDVGTVASIRQNLKSLAKAFTQGARQDIGSFNIIPGSTLFLEEAWSDIDEDDLAPKLVQLIDKFSFKKIRIICVNKASIDLFWDYLES